MVDNFKQIRELLEFRSSDDFYFIQVLQRKKDFPDIKVNGANNNSRLIKAYYVHSLDYFDFIKPEIIELCKIFGARAGINLNRRSYEQMAFHLLRKVADQIMNRSFDKAHAAYNSVVGAYCQEDDKRWIIDIDNIRDTESYLSMLTFIDYECEPEGKKIITEIPSKSGFHVITRPFNLQKFKKNYPDIEVHKNNPTNLYIP